MKTLCIMVLRNGLSMTKPAVKSILAQTEPCDILLIDNASSDGTAQWMNTLHYPVACSFLREQIPLAAAWNMGLHIAFDRHAYDAAWVVNSDVLFRPDTLKWLNADDRPFVTCVSVRTEEQLNVEVVTPGERARPHPDFSSFRMLREVWYRGFRFDERYLGAYGEDSQGHYDLHRMGVECVCIDVPFLHYGSGTILDADPAEKRRVQVQAEKNRKLFRSINGCEIGSPEYYALFKTSSSQQHDDRSESQLSNDTPQTQDSASEPDEQA